MRRYYGVVVGPLIVSTCMQGGGHPWVDVATTFDAESTAYRARAIRPSLRRKANRGPGRALVVGWRWMR